VPELAPETWIDGRYRVLDRLGSGGMADVFCAEDTQLGRRVALKLLHHRFAADAEFVERFRREAQSAAGLQHPNIVGIYDRGQWEGTSYIAMEYLPGRTLKELIVAEAPLAPQRAIELTTQILKGARFAHKRGVIHRDLKPHNAMVDDEDRVKVTDFGIARAGASDMTETGSILGTAQYLSPEQAQGHAVSEQSDLYAIGVILYELLTGRLPFEADTAVAIAVKHVSETPPPPSALNAAIPPELDRVVLWALEKDPVRRPPDADALLAALEEVRAGLGAGATHTTAFVPVAPPAAEPPPDEVVVEEEPSRRRRWLLLALLLLLLAGGGVAAYLLTRPEKVTVLKVVGDTQAVATTRLLSEGLTVTVTTGPSSSKANVVISQNPLAGEQVKKGSPVSLVVSSGPGQVTVPNVRGDTLASARAQLKKAGFKVTTQEAPSASVAKGRVVSVSPDVGQRVDRGFTVRLMVSTGPALVTIPGVIGQDRASARSELESGGFTVTETQLESTKAVGTVLAQSPTAGAAVTKGTTVTITVAIEAPVAVPDVVGLGSDAATNKLTAAGFTTRVQTKTVKTAAEDGKVVSQTPASGGKVKKGAAITIVVGKFTPTNGQPGGTGTGTGTGTTPTGTNTTP